MSVNTSGITPLGHAVLVKTYDPEVRSSILAIPDSVRGALQQLEQRCTVVSVGPEAWKGEAKQRAEPGDRVLVTKYAGYVTNQTEDGQDYRVVNDRDIFARIDWRE